MNPKISDQPPEARTRGGASAASLGAQLRAAREAQGVSLRHVSEQTRIQMRYLEAIETDNFQQLPGGIFNRSFVKAYARQVNFSEDEAIEAYNRMAREQGAPLDEEMPTSYQPHVYTNGDSTRSPWINILLAVFILGIISIGAYALQHWYTRTATETPAPVVNSAPANTVAPAQPSPTVAPAAPPLSVQVKTAGEDISLRVEADGGQPARFELNSADTAREYTAQNNLRLQYAPAKARFLEVTINGRRARVPPRSSEMRIASDTYQQLLQ